MSDRYKENNLEEVADSGKDSVWRSGVMLSTGQGCQAIGGGSSALCGLSPSNVGGTDAFKQRLSRNYREKRGFRY